MPDDAITLLCATGTHRQATPPRCRSSSAPRSWIATPSSTTTPTSDEHVEVGEVDGTPVLLQRHYVEADVRIVTGFVEPHFFAGFSGGPKAVCPGLAATETILEAHHPRRIADAEATFVTRSGNPVHDFVRAAVALAPPALLDRCGHQPGPPGHRRVRRPAARAHDAACAFVESSAVREVEAPFDVVVSTNGGYPARPQPLPGGQGHGGGRARSSATAGSSCWPPPAATASRATEPSPGCSRGARTPDDLVDAPGAPELDRWQAQVLGRVLPRAQVWLCTAGA